ncbi:MAG: hypothetical protein VZQ62_08315 [Methanosphaera sp.]|nr:hypothetical protein [Methanosphaera sp.]
MFDEGLLVTLSDAAEHTAIVKAFGSYTNYQICKNNLNYIHELQSQKGHVGRLVETVKPSTAWQGLMSLLAEQQPKPQEQSMDLKTWFNSLSKEEKAMLKELNK